MPEFVTGKFEENLRVDEIPGSGIYLLKENYLGPNVWKSIYLSCLHENRFDLTYIGSYYFYPCITLLCHAFFMRI